MESESSSRLKNAADSVCTTLLKSSPFGSICWTVFVFLKFFAFQVFIQFFFMFSTVLSSISTGTFYKSKSLVPCQKKSFHNMHSSSGESVLPQEPLEVVISHQLHLDFMLPRESRQGNQRPLTLHSFSFPFSHWAEDTKACKQIPPDSWFFPIVTRLLHWPFIS